MEPSCVRRSRRRSFNCCGEHKLNAFEPNGHSDSDMSAVPTNPKLLCYSLERTMTCQGGKHARRAHRHTAQHRSTPRTCKAGRALEISPWTFLSSPSESRICCFCQTMQGVQQGQGTKPGSEVESMASLPSQPWASTTTSCPLIQHS